MAGSISLSLSQQFDELGRPLSNGQLYFIQAGTTSTPQNAYQDSGLSIPHPNPLTLNSAGRVPQLFFADGSIKIRLLDQYGVPQIDADNILVVGPSSGGGGGGTVDPTTVIQTGQVTLWYVVGVQPGFVRLNGRTIGSASSGATERANADTLALFTFLYNVDGTLAVSGGRSGNAAADFAANKNLALPDFRGAVPAALGDMGSTDRNELNVAYFGASGTTLGARGGSQATALVTSNLPPYTPTGAVTGAISGTDLILVNGIGAQNLQGGTTGFGWSNSPTVKAIASALSWAGSFVGVAQGGVSNPFRTVQPTILLTYYVKL